MITYDSTVFVSSSFITSIPAVAREFGSTPAVIKSVLTPCRVDEEVERMQTGALTGSQSGRERVDLHDRLWHARVLDLQQLVCVIICLNPIPVLMQTVDRWPSTDLPDYAADPHRRFHRHRCRGFRTVTPRVARGSSIRRIRWLFRRCRCHCGRVLARAARKSDGNFLLRAFITLCIWNNG